MSLSIAIAFSDLHGEFKNPLNKTISKNICLDFMASGFFKLNISILLLLEF